MNYNITIKTPFMYPQRDVLLKDFTANSVKNAAFEFKLVEPRILMDYKDTTVGFVESVVDNDSGETVDLNTLKMALTFDFSITKDTYEENGGQLVSFTVKVKDKKVASKGKTTTTKVESSSDIVSKVKEAVAQGCIDEDNAMEIVEYLESKKYLRIPAPKELIMSVIEYWISHNREEKGSKPKAKFVDTYDNINFYKEESIVTMVLGKALAGSSFIFEGDKSTGKGVMAETICWILNLPYRKDILNNKMTANDLFETKTTVPSALDAFDSEKANKAIEIELSLKLNEKKMSDLTPEEKELLIAYNYAKDCSMAPRLGTERGNLLQAAPVGIPYFADEINHGNSNTVAALHPFADGSKTFYAKSGTVEINKDFFIIGTQNVGSNYTSTNRLDAATMSRFDVVKFPYHKDILNILMESCEEYTKTRLPRKYFEKCNELYIKFQDANQKGNISDDTLNIRGFVRALNETAAVMVNTKGLEMPMTKLSKAITTCVVNATSDAGNDVILNLINNIIGDM